MAEVAFRPARQLSEYKGKGASASREDFNLKITLYLESGMHYQSASHARRASH